MQKNEVTLGHLAAIFTVAIWSTTYISTKILLGSFHPVEIMVYRFAIGFLALLVIGHGSMPLKKKRHELLFALAGLCGITFYFTLQNIALTYTYASNACVVISTAPIFTALLSRILMGRETRLSVNFFIGFAVAIIGILLISFNGARMELNPLGDLLNVCAAIIWGFYSVITRKISNLGYHTMRSTRKIFFYGLLFMIPIVLWMDIDFSFAALAVPENILHLLYLGIGASAVCFFTWNHAIRVLGAVKTSVYIYLEPAITVVTSMLILGEHITYLAVIGTVLTMTGLILSERRARR